MATIQLSSITIQSAIDQFRENIFDLFKFNLSGTEIKLGDTNVHDLVRRFSMSDVDGMIFSSL